MEHIIHNLHHFMEVAAEFAIVALEIIGIIIILYGSISAIVNWAKSKFDLTENRTKIILGESLALALEFMLGAEIIKTLTTTDLNKLYILGIIVVLRVVLTYVIHWEVKEADLACEFHHPESYTKK